MITKQRWKIPPAKDQRIYTDKYDVVCSEVSDTVDCWECQYEERLVKFLTPLIAGSMK